MTAPDTLRLRTLLAWAVEFVERETDCLVQSHTWPNGRIYDTDVEEEVAAARRWLKEAREMGI